VVVHFVARANSTFQVSESLAPCRNLFILLPLFRCVLAACCSFINRDDLDFAGIASMAPVQEWDLQESNDGSLEYPTQ
jgi:hypothetical protein